jgi:hypothetical protein
VLGRRNSPLGTALLNLLLLLAVAAFVSLVIRFRRSRGEERQQLKWFTYAGAAGAAGAAGGVGRRPTHSAQQPGLRGRDRVPAGGCGDRDPALPALRDRPADQPHPDYGLLTVLLGAVYIAGVFGLGQLLNPVTGESALAVAASTLAVAALFQPARRRVQAVVDRRFNRRRYDAAKTIEALSARLRDQIDLDTLSTELLAIVDQTTEPTRASLWLRPSAPGSSGTPRSEARPTTWPTDHNPHLRTLPSGCSSVKAPQRRTTSAVHQKLHA